MKSLLIIYISAPQPEVKRIPLPATPVQLPVGPSNEVLRRKEYTAGQIFERFLTVHKTGPTLQHAQALNVSSATEATLEELLPTAHLPPASWQDDPKTTRGSKPFQSVPKSVATLSNGAQKPEHDAYFARAKELLVDNDEAFRTIRREQGLNEKPLVRLAHFRKFWDALSQMADYWDTSLDQYTNGTTDEKKETMDLDQSDTSTDPTSYAGRRIGTGREMPPRYRDEAASAFVETIVFAFRCKVDRPRTEPKLKLHNLLIPLLQTGSVYRYPRDSQAARKGVLEGPLLGIQCTNQMVFRRPDEAQEVVGQGDLANFLREIGLMLGIAEKRSREGRTEPQPGESEWWLTKPRWGGAPDVGEIGISEEAPRELEFKLPFLETPDNLSASSSTKRGPVPISATVGRTTVGTADRTSRRQQQESGPSGAGAGGDDSEGSAKGRKRTKRSTAIDSWKNLQPSSSSWEKNVSYKQIGRHKAATHDDVHRHLSRFPSLPFPSHPLLTNDLSPWESQIYIISSLMHHISILHCRIHPSYTTYLSNPIPHQHFIPAREPWYQLEVRRSRWFDLLKREDRGLAMRGIWGVMDFLMRDLGEDGC